MALAAIRPKRLSIFWWGILALLAASGGFVAQGGLRSLQTSLEASLIQWVTKYFRRDGADLRESRTSIGHPGNIHLSGRIVYRVTPEPLSPPPTYLREASYDSYGNGVWAATYHAKRVLTPEQKTLLKEMLEKYDANKDGKLEKKERAKMTKEDKEKCKKAGLFTPKKGEGKKSATK